MNNLRSIDYQYAEQELARLDLPELEIPISKDSLVTFYYHIFLTSSEDGDICIALLQTRNNIVNKLLLSSNPVYLINILNQLNNLNILVGPLGDHSEQLKFTLLIERLQDPELSEFVRQLEPLFQYLYADDLLTLLTSSDRDIKLKTLQAFHEQKFLRLSSAHMLIKSKTPEDTAKALIDIFDSVQEKHHGQLDPLGWWHYEYRNGPRCLSKLARKLDETSTPDEKKVFILNMLIKNPESLQVANVSRSIDIINDLYTDSFAKIALSHLSFLLLLIKTIMIFQGSAREQQIKEKITTFLAKFSQDMSHLNALMLGLRDERNPILTLALLMYPDAKMDFPEVSSDTESAKNKLSLSQWAILSLLRQAGRSPQDIMHVKSQMAIARSSIEMT